jgi:hypothetical protein
VFIEPGISACLACPPTLLNFPTPSRTSRPASLVCFSTTIIASFSQACLEIQELRHETHGDSSGASTIDVALTGLDERLAAVRVGVRAVDEAIKPILASAPAPTQANRADGDDVGALSRKHTALLDEWAAVQREAELLRDELREDKWLTVFRTVTEQADGMMGSLEKAIHRCQVGKVSPYV